jgi:hypothetical protein
MNTLLPNHPRLLEMIFLDPRAKEKLILPSFPVKRHMLLLKVISSSWEVERVSGRDPPRRRLRSLNPTLDSHQLVVIPGQRGRKMMIEEVVDVEMGDVVVVVVMIDAVMDVGAVEDVEVDAAVEGVLVDVEVG